MRLSILLFQLTFLVWVPSTLAADSKLSAWARRLDCESQMGGAVPLARRLERAGQRDQALLVLEKWLENERDSEAFDYLVQLRRTMKFQFESLTTEELQLEVIVQSDSPTPQFFLIFKNHVELRSSIDGALVDRFVAKGVENIQVAENGTRYILQYPSGRFELRDRVDHSFRKELDVRVSETHQIDFTPDSLHIVSDNSVREIGQHEVRIFNLSGELLSAPVLGVSHVESLGRGRFILSYRSHSGVELWEVESDVRQGIFTSPKRNSLVRAYSLHGGDFVLRFLEPDRSFSLSVFSAEGDLKGQSAEPRGFFPEDYLKEAEQVLYRSEKEVCLFDLRTLKIVKTISLQPALAASLPQGVQEHLVYERKGERRKGLKNQFFITTFREKELGPERVIQKTEFDFEGNVIGFLGSGEGEEYGDFFETAGVWRKTTEEGLQFYTFHSKQVGQIRLSGGTDLKLKYFSSDTSFWIFQGADHRVHFFDRYGVEFDLIKAPDRIAAIERLPGSTALLVVSRGGETFLLRSYPK